MSLHMEVQQTQNVAERGAWKPRVIAVVMSVVGALVVAVRVLKPESARAAHEGVPSAAEPAYSEAG